MKVSRKELVFACVEWLRNLENDRFEGLLKISGDADAESELRMLSYIDALEWVRIKVEARVGEDEPDGEFVESDDRDEVLRLSIADARVMLLRKLRNPAGKARRRCDMLRMVVVLSYLEV